MSIIIWGKLCNCCQKRMYLGFSCSCNMSWAQILLCVRSTPGFKNDTNLNSTNLLSVVFAFCESACTYPRYSKFFSSFLFKSIAPKYWSKVNTTQLRVVCLLIKKRILPFNPLLILFSPLEVLWGHFFIFPSGIQDIVL